MTRLIMFSLLLAGVSGCYSRPAPLVTGLEGNPLPSFSILLMDSTEKINTDNIPTGKPTVFFYFNPYCLYCRAQTDEITREIKGLKNIQIYLLSNFPFNQVKDYYKQYKLNKYSNITVAQDFDSYFVQYFKASAVPFLAIYGADKRLKQVFIGKTDISEIKHTALD